MMKNHKAFQFSQYIAKQPLHGAIDDVLVTDETPR